MPDPWFRGIELSYGPDGSVLMLDWSDTGDYHDNTGVHRESGRIYEMSYGDPPSRAAERSRDVAKLSVAHWPTCTPRNEWFARKARLELIVRWDGRGSEREGASA